MMKAYEPSKFEKKWQDKWYSSSIYRAEDKSEKPKYYLLNEFPYPSGDGLHVGHCKTYTMIDAVARFLRMSGYNVLYPMGWDAFGLPTENFAIKMKVKPQAATEKNVENFKRQMKLIGLSYDWSREVNTTDPEYYRWTQWLFLKFFEKGLAYKQKMPINWCPKCKVGLANEEVIDGKHERCGTAVGTKELNQWMLKITAYADRLADELDQVDYSEAIKLAQRNWIGRKEWIDISYPIEGTKELVVVSTTRPDTNFGATFVVLAPEHPILDPKKGLVPEKYLSSVEDYIKKAKSKTVEEREAEGREKTGVFTGLYAVNQLNEKKLPIYVADFALMSVGTGAVVGVPGHDMRDFEFAKKFDLPVIRVVVGSDGDKSPITKKEQVQEEEGTIINSEFLDGMDVHAATKKVMDYLEEKGWGKRTVRYHLRDWLFSRQHYWGEPIPVVHCEKCGTVAVPEDQLPVKLPDVDSYEPTETGESPLAAIKDWVNTKCPKCGGPAKRETDTMPNWAGSSWYFYRYCDPSNNKAFADKKKLEYWMPVDFYDGGAEHTTLHLLYSRFWHKFLNDLGLVPGKEPYKARRNHGMLLGEGAVKMSKSLGNVITPDEMVEKYSADILRLYLLFTGPYAATSEWSDRAIQGIDRFTRKFWGYLMENAEKKTKESGKDVDRELNRLIARFTESIPERRFNTMVAALMEFYNTVGKQPISVESLKKLTCVVAPLVPHMAEEFWVALGDKGSVHEQKWPEADKLALKTDTIEIPIQVNGKVRGSVSISVNEKEVDIKEKSLKLSNVTKFTQGKEPRKFIYVPGKIVNIVV